MTYLYLATAYLLASPTLATLHIAAVYFREYRANRRARRTREDEVLELEELWQLPAKERV